MTPLLEMADVARVYRDGRTTRRAIDAIDLVLMPGELVAVMGPSGSGKTTLLNLCAGLEAPSRGVVTMHGHKLEYSATAMARRLREQVAMVYQQGNLLRDLTAAQNVALPLELVGVRAAEALDRARLELQAVGLQADADELPERLSGGERQRVAVARALVGERRILLADEPTGALETTSAEQLMRLIRDRTTGDRAAIVATHDQRLAAYADRVVYLRDGKIAGQVGVAMSDQVPA